MAFTGVTNAHRPSSQPTACTSPTCSLTPSTGSNQAPGKVLTYFPQEVWGGRGSNQVTTYLVHLAGLVSERLWVQVALSHL